MRSYAAAGQALVLMAFVPFYSWFASRVDRVKLLVGITLFFVVNIELFALAVAAGCRTSASRSSSGWGFSTSR